MCLLTFPIPFLPGLKNPYADSSLYGLWVDTAGRCERATSPSFRQGGDFGRDDSTVHGVKIESDFQCRLPGLLRMSFKIIFFNKINNLA